MNPVKRIGLRINKNLPFFHSSTSKWFSLSAKCNRIDIEFIAYNQSTSNV